MATASNHYGMDHFPFFALPRELRDAVYEHLKSEPRYMKYPRFPFQDVDIAIRGSLNPDLLLVSKQFRHEYRQMEKNRGVLIIDVIKVHCRPTFRDIPQAMKEATDLEMTFRAQNALGKSELRAPHDSVQAVLRMLPGIRKARVKILCTRGRVSAPPSSMTELWRQVREDCGVLDELLAVEEVQSVEIFSAESPPNGDWVCEKDHHGLKLIGAWRRGERWRNV